MFRYIALIVAPLALTACGVPGDTPLVDLEDKQITKICEDQIKGFEAQTVDCDGTEVTTEAASQSDCEAGFDFPSDCTATLDDYYDCVDGLESDPCNFGGSACDAIFECYGA